MIETPSAVRAPLPRTTQQMATGATAAGALLAATVGIVARHRVYGGETHALADAAVAQDLVTALIAVPVLACALVLTLRGSDRAYLVGLGVLAFLAYNYAIYCFSITFGPLFLVWTALLGLSTYLLLGGLWRARAGELCACVRPHGFAAATLCVVSVMFAALWLKEVVTDLLDGSVSTSAASWNVPTNPVHVLDLALFLPLAFAAGWHLRRRRPWAMIAAPVMLTFFILTSIPIIVTPVVAALREHDAAWGAVAPVAVVAMVCTTAMVKLVGRSG